MLKYCSPTQRNSITSNRSETTLDSIHKIIINAEISILTTGEVKAFSTMIQGIFQTTTIVINVNALTAIDSKAETPRKRQIITIHILEECTREQRHSSLQNHIFTHHLLHRRTDAYAYGRNAKSSTFDWCIKYKFQSTTTT